MNRMILMSSLSLVAFLGLQLVCCQDAKIADRDPQLSDLIFIENLLFEQKATSKIDCARLCLQTDRCVTFSFPPVTSGDDVCRGHSTRMNSGAAYEVSVGTGLYVFPKADWLNTPCSAEADCTEPNSWCRNATCTCIHGYYYSVGAKVCQEDCLTSDLQNTYLRFDFCILLTHNSGTHVNVTLETCQELCDNDDACLHYEYADYKIKCLISYFNTRLMTLVDGWIDPYDWAWSHFQRNCA